MVKTGKVKDIHEEMKILVTELQNIINALDKIDKMIPLGGKKNVVKNKTTK